MKWCVLASGVLISAHAAFAQAQNPPATNCRNSVLGYNTGTLTNNCGNIYLRPPPLKNVIYQNGREIANVDGHLQIKNDGSCLIGEIYNTKLESYDATKPLDYDGHSFLITNWVPYIQAEMTANGLHTNVMRNVKCKIIK
jgi:hypothetical protein